MRDVGMTLDPNQGDKVQAVGPDSAAAKAGLKAEDMIVKLNGHPIHSFADAVTDAPQFRLPDTSTESARTRRSGDLAGTASCGACPR